jgi:hypothetical protein
MSPPVRVLGRVIRIPEKMFHEPALRIAQIVSPRILDCVNATPERFHRFRIVSECMLA